MIKATKDLRPSWDDWFMGIATIVSQRSLDPDTKHGCVVTSDDKTILAIGYNSPPRGCNDIKIPISRPEKYLFFEHAESNAINNAARTGISLFGSTFYITGHPCAECFRRIINVGAKRIIVGEISSACIGLDTMAAIKTMNSSIEIIHLKNTNNVLKLLTHTSQYLMTKIDMGKL